MKENIEKQINETEKKLKELKRKRVEEVKEKLEQEKENLQKKLILEPCKVLGIVPRFKECSIEIEDEFELNLIGEENKFWKVVSDDLIIPQIKGFEKNFEVYKISDSKYSKEFIDKAKKISKVFGYGDKPEIFLCWNNKEERYIQEVPCLIIFERTLVFILAPRVESE